MTVIHAVADVHIGNHHRFGGAVVVGQNARSRRALAALDTAAARALAASTHAFVVAGDLFDTDTPNPQTVAAVQGVLRGLPRALLLTGNHDVRSTAPGDNALAPLRVGGNVGLIDAPKAMLNFGSHFPPVDLITVPFLAGRTEDQLPGALAALGLGGIGAHPRVLVIHAGVRDDATPPWLRDAHDSVHVDALTALCRDHGISVCLAGNWHERRLWRGGQLLSTNAGAVFDARPEAPVVFQLGALVPTGFDNPGLVGYGTLACVEARPTSAGLHVSYTEAPGPRFVVHRGADHPPTPTLPKDRLCAWYLSWRDVPPDQLPAARATLAGLVDAGQYTDGEVLPDKGAATAAARTAAQAARSAETLADAAHAFVAAMALPDGVDRAAVAAHVRGYLRL